MLNSGIIPEIMNVPYLDIDMIITWGHEQIPLVNTLIYNYHRSLKGNTKFEVTLIVIVRGKLKMNDQHCCSEYSTNIKLHSVDSLICWYPLNKEHLHI